MNILILGPAAITIAAFATIGSHPTEIIHFSKTEQSVLPPSPVSLSLPIVALAEPELEIAFMETLTAKTYGISNPIVHPSPVSEISRRFYPTGFV